MARVVFLVVYEFEKSFRFPNFRLGEAWMFFLQNEYSTQVGSRQINR